MPQDRPMRTRAMDDPEDDTAHRSKANGSEKHAKKPWMDARQTTDEDVHALKAEIAALLFEEVSNVKLGPALVELLTEYYVDIAGIEGPGEVDLDDLPEVAEAAWEELRDGTLPVLHARRIAKYVAMASSVKQPSNKWWRRRRKGGATRVHTEDDKEEPSGATENGGEQHLVPWHRPAGRSVDVDDQELRDDEETQVQTRDSVGKNSSAYLDRMD